MERDISEYIVAMKVKPMCSKKTRHQGMRIAIAFFLEKLFI